MSLRIVPGGDTAIVVEFGDRIERGLSDRVLRADARLRAAALAGVVETVPTFRSLMVHYDPLATSAAQLARQIEPLMTAHDDVDYKPRTWRLPVCYDGEKAPDLEDVARRTGLTAEQVIEAHSGRVYHVYMIGFLPGYPYLGDLAPAICIPRRADPRIRVPSGAVGIATTVTAVYPLESPGGWHLIGMTPVRLFDSTKAEPALLAPGDAVSFVPVEPAEFDDIAARVAAGDYSAAAESAGP